MKRAIHWLGGRGCVQTSPVGARITNIVLHTSILLTVEKSVSELREASSFRMTLARLN